MPRRKHIRRREANDERIIAIWRTVSNEFDAKSTEFCVQMTADRANVSYERVIDAMMATREGH